MTDTIKDFEAAIAELETIVKKLEEGDLALEKSLELYERGVQLSRFCHTRLEAAEKRIEILNERGDLRPPPARISSSARSRRSRSISARVARRSRRRSSAFCRPRPRALRDCTTAMRYSLEAGGKRLRPILDAGGRRGDCAAHGFCRARDRGGAARRVRHRAHSHLLADP